MDYDPSDKGFHVNSSSGHQQLSHNHYTGFYTLAAKRLLHADDFIISSRSRMHSTCVDPSFYMQPTCTMMGTRCCSATVQVKFLKNAEHRILSTPADRREAAALLDGLLQPSASHLADQVDEL
jgi:hypothetical protein